MEMKIRDVLFLAALIALIGAIGMALPVQAAPGDPGVSGQSMVNRQWEGRIDASAATSSLEAEWCLTTSSAALPASKYLVDAKSLYVDNRSSTDAFLRIDAASVVTTGAAGLRWTAGAERAIDLNGRTFGPNIRGASKANMTTGACLYLLWLQ